MTLKTSVYCTYQWEDFHCRPDAPDAVAFLRDRHRHIFHTRVEIPVSHDDRDVEFIMMKRDLESFIKTEVIDRMWVHKSCEMIAKKILEHIKKEYEPSWAKIEVSEDWENWAVLHYSVD